MRDEKKRLSFNGGSSNGHKTWGCPCCQTGNRSSYGRKRLRRLAKSRAKQAIAKMIRKFV